MPHTMFRRRRLEVLCKASAALPIDEYFFLWELTQSGRDIHIFSKHLQWLDFEQMAKTAAEIGFDGVDLTVVRKGMCFPKCGKPTCPKQ
ncbi:MAG: hypothetical protein IPJ00_21720 [Saprospirales bacterium]|nr:hypothetical protein [Saprospirales bacterium]